MALGESFWAFLALIARIVIGAWMSHKEKVQRKKEIKKKAKALHKEGMDECDPSKRTAAFSRSKRARR